MSTSNENSKSGKDLTKILGLSARDIEVLVKGYSCMQDEVKIDYTKLAELGNFSSIVTARNQWNITKRKINSAMTSNGENENGETEPPTTPGTPTDLTKTPASKRKRMAKDAGDTPTKRGRPKKNTAPSDSDTPADTDTPDTPDAPDAPDMSEKKDEFNIEVAVAEDTGEQ